MLKFMRNKIVRIYQRQRDSLLADGLLADDIYDLEIRVEFSIPDLEILDIEGKWNRWTTPECPRAIPMLQKAVGMKAIEQGFSEKIKKIVGRRSCRHFANLLLECSYAAKLAAMSMGRETQDSNKESVEFQDRLVKKDQPEKPIRLEASSGYSGAKIEEASPEASSEKLHKKGLCIDLHVHTSPASPCSSAPVSELIKEAKRIGLDGICLTDHNYVWEEAEVQRLREEHNFLILRGNEITTDQGDMLVFGFYEKISGIPRLEELYEEVKKTGGVIIAAHPFRGFLTFGVGKLGLTVEKAAQRPLFQWVDAVEVLNSKVTEKENAFSMQVARRLNLPGTGGSDAHEVQEVGIYTTCFEIPIKNERDLVEALRSNTYTPISYRKALKEQTP